MPVPAGPTDLYTDLDTVKAALGKLTVDDRDDLIGNAIRAACRMIDRRTGRRFYADVGVSPRVFSLADNTYATGHRHAVLVDDIASADSLAVAADYGSGTFTAVTGWLTGPDNALAYGRPITELRSSYNWQPYLGHGYGRSRGYASLQVTALWGWPAVPDEIAQAAQLLAARLYRRKDSPEGVLGTSEWGVTRVSRADPDVESLIGPFVISAIA